MVDNYTKEHDLWNVIEFIAVNNKGRCKDDGLRFTMVKRKVNRWLRKYIYFFVSMYF